MYTTLDNRQIKRQLDRVEEKVGTGKCIQHRIIDREIVRVRGGGGRQVQIDVYNIEQQIDSKNVRQRGGGGGGGGGSYRQMYTTFNNRQIERQLEREEEEEEVGTDRFI